MPIEAFYDLCKTIDTGFQRLFDRLCETHDELRDIIRKLDRMIQENQAFLAEMREKEKRRQTGEPSCGIGMTGVV